MAMIFLRKEWEYKDLSDVSAYACYGDTSWETNAFEVAPASTATRFRRTCCQLVSSLWDIPGIFPGSEYTYSGASGVRRLARARRPPSLAESFTRFLALSHFSVTNFAGVESLYRHLWANATTTMTPTRFQQRIVVRKSLPSSRRCIFFHGTQDWFSYSYSEGLFPRISIGLQARSPTNSTWTHIYVQRLYKTNLRDSGINNYEEHNCVKCSICDIYGLIL